MDFQEVECGTMDWIEVDQDKDRFRVLVNKVMKLQVSYKAGNFLTSRESVSCSSKTLLHRVSK
jgi:hypothetical protein